MAFPIYSYRPYRGPSDLQAMIDLVSMRPPERITAYPFIVDLQEIAGTDEGQATFQLWEDANGVMAAFALLNDAFIAFEISPLLPDFNGLAEQIIAWGTEKVTSPGVGSDPPGELATNCREEDTQRRSFLEEHHFSAQPVGTLHFMRSLSSPSSAPQLPDVFHIRPLAGEAEAEAWIKLHHAAHDNQSMTVEFRLSMMRTTEYQPELDLVAVAPDGQLAAYVMGHFSVEENALRHKKVGYTDPVATHPNFQGQGLARALLLACFERLKNFGMEFAELSTWGENTGMIKTAESAGFERYSTTIFFSRAL